MSSVSPTLVLASTSTTRLRLLKSLRLPVSVVKPEFTEIESREHDPRQTAILNAAGKAQAVVPFATDQYGSNVVIIGSDQVCCLPTGEQLHKPLTIDNAIAQLSLASGKQLTFYTALTVINTDCEVVSTVTESRVSMRTLTQDEIRSYVLADRPLWSAGSFHAEGAGLHVIERIETDDINGLYGLPVLKLLSILRDLGTLPALLID